MTIEATPNTDESKNSKVTGTGKPVRICANCGCEYDNYQLESSKFCGPNCRSAYSKKNRPLIVQPDKTIEPQPPSSFSMPPMNKMNATEGVPAWFYQEKLALINKLEIKNSELEKELKQKIEEVHNLEKNIAVKDVTNTKPEGLGALASPEVITALIQNPDSIKHLMEGVGRIIRPGQQQIGGTDNPLMQEMASLPANVQEQASYVCMWFMRNPVRLAEFYNQLVNAAGGTNP